MFTAGARSVKKRRDNVHAARAGIRAAGLDVLDSPTAIASREVPARSPAQAFRQEFGVGSPAEHGVRS